MHQRTSSRFYKNGGGVGDGSEATNGDKYNADKNKSADIWGIIKASHAKVSPTSSTTASTYETNIFKIKAGVDGVVSSNENGKFIVGLNTYYGTANTNITSINGNGSIVTKGFGVGLTGTYFDERGFYVDGQLQIGWNYSDLNSTAMGALVANNLGQTYGASVENEQSFIGDDGTASSSNLYALANIYYDLSGASQVDVSGTKLTTQPNRLSGEIGIGGSYNFGGGKYAINGQASLASSLENMSNNYQYKGSLGFKAKF